MKIRESGMPDETMWSTFFDPSCVLKKLGLDEKTRGVVEFGCGYGTFIIPAARIVGGTVYAIDIDPNMLERTRAVAEAQNLRNIELIERDFVSAGTGLAEGTVDYAMLFNIIHAEAPHLLLREAYRVLRLGGLLGIMHWNHDPTTPRGPSMEIRPRPEDCRRWAEQVGFELLEPGLIDLPPYHYGLVLKR